jgi:hypothetical protein
MESTTYDVQQTRPAFNLLDGLPIQPTNIKEQMPLLAQQLQSLAANVGRESVQRMLKASMDLRAAFDANDYRAVNEVFKRGHGWVAAQENGFCVGVPENAMRDFAKRHRRS